MLEIYLDETGDNGLNFDDGKSEPWFLIAGIIIDSADRERFGKELEVLARKYFNGGQIKSKNLSDPDKRRSFFKDISKDCWRGIIFQVDKTLLNPDSFKWKQTFYKRVPRQLYNYLITALNEIMIFPDPTGDKKFQESLIKYFVAQSPLDLFVEAKIQFSPSKNSRINQLADLCSGTRFRDIRDKTDIFNIIKHRFSIRTWPVSLRDFIVDDVAISKNIDKRIITAAVNFAKTFVEKNEHNDEPLTRDQIQLINIFLDEVINGDPFRYVASKFLIKELIAKRGEKISDYYLRTEVIGKLRQNGLLIVSNRKGGYKLPVNFSEIEEYFKNMAEKVEPMQYKAESVANHLFTITDRQIFDDPRWRCLRKF